MNYQQMTSKDLHQYRDDLDQARDRLIIVIRGLKAQRDQLTDTQASSPVPFEFNQPIKADFNYLIDRLEYQKSSMLVEAVDVETVLFNRGELVTPVVEK